ncbi:MAG: Spy/CpxP family protein refolding chaperone [Planctomycetes bacterium]|nr:Spy/CpxP family protein refolding chaperone [Planctomycetota bacterium]
MKRLIGVSLVVGLAMLMTAGSLLAQDERPRRQRPAGDTMNREPRFGGRQQMSVAQLNRLLGQLDLNAEQKEKIAELQKTYEKKQAEQREKMAAVREKMQSAGEDQEKRDAARNEMRELSTAGGESWKQLMEGTKAVLTDEQKKKFEELQQPVPSAEAVAKIIEDKAEELKLTDEQKEAVKKLSDEYKPAEGASDEQRKAMEEMRTRMRELRQSGGSQEEMGKLLQEMQAKREAEREKVDQKSREFMAKLAKILNADQMKIVSEAAKAQAQRQPRPEGAERTFRARRQGDQPNRAPEEKKEGEGDSAE